MGLRCRAAHEWIAVVTVVVVVWLPVMVLCGIAGWGVIVGYR